ncbi:hypothetical protein CKO12_01160 [Chromatium okenii]|uniref:hypothetical protein n=1 Tax=Chromatium okenii TaxID=61644 RepID=UPI0019056CEB|nr:hypothetical protein [Chromatium okenii]MBK1640507.1 hypothetical protein [Chromatium okenii]
MIALARFIMRGRAQAALVAATTAMLSLLMPLFGVLSAASVGVVTLRQGGLQGAIVGAIATLGTSILTLLILGTPLSSIGIVLVLWLPTWLLASVLHRSRSLQGMMQLAVFGGSILVLGWRFSVADPAGYWLHLLEPVRQTLVSDGLLTAELSVQVVQHAAQWMTGSVAVAFVLQTLVSLVLARYWQAALYNPGGLGEEFRALNFGHRSGIGFIIVLLWFGISPQAGVIADMLLLLSIFPIIQGLAVAHALHHRLQAAGGWMVGGYVLLLLLMPQTVLIIAGVGMLDIWLDLRSRMDRIAKPPR